MGVHPGGRFAAIFVENLSYEFVKTFENMGPGGIQSLYNMFMGASGSNPPVVYSLGMSLWKSANTGMLFTDVTAVSGGR